MLRGGLGGALAAALPLVARAQGAGTTRVLVGFASGGGGDQVARLIAERLPAAFGDGRSVIVDNRPGGAGKIAVDALLSAPADGRTVLLAPLITPVLSQIVFSRPGYDPARDFAPIALVSHFQFALAVPASHPARTASEFVQWLKANPQKANFGCPSPGSLPHFFGLLLGEAAGVEMLHVAYKGGSPMLADLAGGQITAGIDTDTELLPLHRAGKIRILGSFAPRRVAALPDIPTFAELGYPKASGSAWYSLWARKGVPATAQAELNRAVNTVLGEADVQRKFADWGQTPDPRTPEALERFRVAEIAKWRPVIEASGFRGD